MTQSLFGRIKLVLLPSVCCALWLCPPLQAQSSLSQPTVPAESNSDFSKQRELLQQGKYDQAIAQLQQLASEHPEIRGVARELGIAYYRKSDYFRAAQSLQQALIGRQLRCLAG